MADKDVVLLDTWASPFGMRVRIALAEKGIEYEYREENLADKSPLLIKMNPVYKKIPVLIHKGKPICESSIIVEYIDEVCRNPLFLPEDPYERATERFWVDFINKKIYEGGVRIWTSKGEALEEAKKEFIENFKLLEGVLGDKQFFGGEKLGFVDVNLITFASWFYAYETRGKFKLENECPKLIGWVKRCKEKESVSKTLQDPGKVYDFLLKKYGAG